MARITAPLTDTQIKKAKFDTSKKVTKLFDGKGLYLVIDKNDKKSWRFKYQRPFTKKANTLSFGDYPTVTLAEARKKREAALVLLDQDIDPHSEKIRVINEVLQENQNTFKAVAEEWHSKQNLAESTLKKSNSLLEVIYQNIGNKPIGKITPIDILNICKIYEKQGKLETAKKIKVKCGQIMRYGVATGRCERDVTQDLRGAIQTPVVNHMAAITSPKEFAVLLSDIDHYEGTIITKTALKIAPLVFVRPGELRHAKWADIDFDKNIWSYTPPKTKSKTGVELIVPLSTQVIELLKVLQPITCNSEYVFPAITSTLKPMSENTINQALRRLGYEKEQVSGHGFRASARTLLDEVLHFPVELIEMQLGHQVRDMHGRAYNRTKHLKERKEMMQKWADYCYEIKGVVK